MSYTRFAVYYLPPDGPLAEFGATWLGWDVARGRMVDQFTVPGICDITMTPRKYGFHGTLKPPFRLRAGCDVVQLRSALADLAGGCASAQCDTLQVSRLGSFLALTLVGDTSGIAGIAATCVRELDGFRAPPGEEELIRRRKAGLTDRQDALLARWGYPYVMEEFRFHLTLTGRLPKDAIRNWEEHVRRHLPALPSPFVMDTIALVGEREDGCFELIQRYALTG
ncbi:MAG: DUF1045 domain-containing protein [Roseobacter sp.]